VTILQKFYITTAIDYVNAKPHIGHAYEKIIADVLARYHRLFGDDVFFLTGTDENAQKNVKAAREAGIPVKEFVDKNSKVFVELCKKLNISYDDFIRTTERRHVKVAQEIFKILLNKGFIYKGEYSGLYCTGCEEFKTEKDLVDGLCPEHKTEPEFLSEEAYFFKLSKFKNQILKLLKENLVIPESRRNEMISRLENEELKDLCVSRKGVKWGINVPGDDEHKIYVWIDALTNYLSGIDYPNEKFKRYWPADVHVIGKGINWFHSVIWPALLMAADIEIPKKIFVHGYVNIAGEKISKSLGNIVDPIELTEKYGPDVLRYYLIREIPFGEDGDFSEKHLVARYNNELVENYSNLFYRVTYFIKTRFNGKVPEPDEFDEEDKQILEKIKSTIADVRKQIENFNINSALELVLDLCASTNRYFQKKEPWKGKRAETTLFVSINAIKAIQILLSPFLPETSDKALKALNIEKDWEKIADFIEPGHEIEPLILFRKI